MVIKLLLDENISPAAAVAVAADGIDAWHVRDRGRPRDERSRLLERAYAEDRVLVALNVGDFEKLVRERALPTNPGALGCRRPTTMAAR